MDLVCAAEGGRASGVEAVGWSGAAQLRHGGLNIGGSGATWWRLAGCDGQGALVSRDGGS